MHGYMLCGFIWPVFKLLNLFLRKWHIRSSLASLQFQRIKSFSHKNKIYADLTLVDLIPVWIRAGQCSYALTEKRVTYSSLKTLFVSRLETLQRCLHFFMSTDVFHSVHAEINFNEYINCLFIRLLMNVYDTTESFVR